MVVLTEWISIHALRVEGDRHPLTRFRDRWHFYPRPPGGGRPRGNFHGLYIEIFLSTPSGWRATRAFHTVTRRSDYFYPRPPGGGRQLDGASKGYGAAISIHALRVEGDGTMMRFFPSTNSHFYPRPPGGGRLYRLRCMAHNGDFYPRPPGGGRRTKYLKAKCVSPISIHALRVEGDYRGRESSRALPISIHALRVEGDLAAAVAFVAM